MKRVAAVVLYYDEAAGEFVAQLDVGSVTYQGRGTSAAVACLLVGREFDAYDRGQRRVRIGCPEVT